MSSKFRFSGGTVNESLLLRSHLHSRQRRLERQITKEQIIEAVQKGVKESSSHPGRWKFVFKGIVVITDYDVSEEITCWRDETRDSGVVGDEEDFSLHVILVVDHSASMRECDIPIDKKESSIKVSSDHEYSTTGTIQSFYLSYITIQ